MSQANDSQSDIQYTRACICALQYFINVVNQRPVPISAIFRRAPEMSQPVRSRGQGKNMQTHSMEGENPWERFTAINLLKEKSAISGNTVIKILC